MFQRLRLLPLLAAGLLMQACDYGDIASVGGLAVTAVSAATQGRSSPRATAGTTPTKESFDDSKALYISTVKRGAAAFRAGFIPVATSADVQQDNFCELVLADQQRLDPDDVGGDLSAAECRAEKELARLGDALGDGDAVGFAAAKRTLTGYVAAMDKIISAAEKRATP